MSVQLLATDNTGLTFGGLTGFFFWTVQLVINGQAQPGWSFFLPHTPSPVDLSALVNTAAGGGGGGGFTNPMTTLGDLIDGGASGAATRLAGDTSNTRKFLRTQASGGVATAPVWDTIQAGDVPTLNQNTTGTAANLTGGATLPDYLAPRAVTLTFVASGTTLVDASLGNAFNLTLTASTTTLGNPSNSVDGEVIRVRLIQDATGSRTIAFGANYDFGGAGAPTLSTGASKVDILGFEYVASLSKWCYLGIGLGF
jgi:hypothetical protein